MRSHGWRILVFVLVVASAACSGKGDGEPAASAETAESRDASDRSTVDQRASWREQWREEALAGKDGQKTWEYFSRAAQAELSKPGADPSDIAGKAKTLANEPQKIFEFIRDHIALEPYVGVLRGARGALVAGAGNALDRALLAQEMLSAGGVESRLVAGRLSDAQATDMLNRFLAGDPVPEALAGLLKPADEARLSAEAARLSNMTGLSEDDLNELLHESVTQAQKFWAATDAQRANSFEQLSGRLQAGKVKMAIDREAVSAKLRERLRKHYWLQVRESDGSWSDFDTAFPDAARATNYGSEPSLLPEIPKEEYHLLEFSLVYQTLMDGALQENVLVAGTYASADALFKPLEFRILPIEMAVDPNALAAMDIGKKIEVLRGIRRYQGILRSGGDVSGSRIFDLQGNTYDDAAPLLPVTGGTFADAFGGGGESVPQFVELRVVMKLTGPDRQPMTQVRTLVRSRDTQAPTFAPPLLEWELLLQPQWVSAEFVGYRAVRQVVATGNARAKSSAAGQPPGAFEPPQTGLVLPLQVALLRQIAAAGILTERAGVKALVDEPMLMISGYRIGEIHADKGQITTERSIDIVENAVRYVAGNDAAQSRAYEAALKQSVADATIEDRFLREVFPESDTQSGTTIFEQAVTAERPALLARVQDIDNMRSAGMTEADIEWVYDNEHPAARLLIATTADGRDAWWSIRPDGNAILRVNGGRGSSLTETALITTKVSFAVICAIQFGLTEYNSRQQSGGIWSEEGSDRVTFCLITTALAGGLFVGGLAAHIFHWGSLALAGVELVHLWQ